MKALKEKRISLRSLWRRGLVILSLFALVFASCAESGEDETVTTDPPVIAGPKVRSVQLLTGTAATGTGALANVSYEGFPVDLTGLKVLVRYGDAPTDTKVFEYGKTEGAKYSTYPPYAVGVLGKDGDDDLYWMPMTRYDLIMDIGGELFTQPLTIPDVIPVLRDPTWAKVEGSDTTEIYELPDGDWEENNISMSKGLNLTGNFGLKAYVDDYPNFAAGGFRMQPVYADGEKFEISINEKTEWRITPRYNNGKEATGRGDFWVDVGSNPLPASHSYVTGALTDYNTAHTATLALPTTTFSPVQKSAIDPVLSASHPYDEVWHVKRVELLGVDPLPEALDYFYWMSDEDTDWIDRLIEAGASIKVTYTDGNPGDKTFTVEEASRLNVVWQNTVGWLPGDDTKPLAVRGIQASSADGATVHNRNRDPKITVLYRGVPATPPLQVPVYTRLVTFVAQPIEGETIEVDMRQDDNDQGTMNALAFSKKIKATATFSAFFNQELTKDLEIVFAEKIDSTGSAYELDSTNYAQGVPVTFAKTDKIEGSAVELAQAGAYSMNFGEHAEWDKDTNDWSVVAGKEGWGQSNTVRNNGREAAVVVYYKPPVVEAAGVTSTSVRNSRVPVLWSNIHVR